MKYKIYYGDQCLCRTVEHDSSYQASVNLGVEILQTRRLSLLGLGGAGHQAGQFAQPGASGDAEQHLAVLERDLGTVAQELPRRDDVLEGLDALGEIELLDEALTLDNEVLVVAVLDRVYLELEQAVVETHKEED